MRAWIEAHVEIVGEIEQPHVRSWATVLRVPTPAGPVWFKAAREGFDHEGPVLALVAPLAPDLLPEVLASRPEGGWLLLADGGSRAREHPVDWPELLARYARLQLAAEPLAEQLLAAGAPDYRPAALPERVDALLPWLSPATRARFEVQLPEVLDSCARLAASPLAATLEHGDLHDGNVFSRGGQTRILDWGDSAVAHPFLTLSVGNDGGAELDAYLEPFTAIAPRAELDAAAETVLDLRFVLRAINWERVVRYDASHATTIEDRVLRFLS